MMTAVILFGLLSTLFQEDVALWERIDNLRNTLYRSTFSAEELQEHFAEAMDIALSAELAQQLEDIRAVAYENDEYAILDEYIDRAAPAIQVVNMGESITSGVNVLYFLNKSTPGTEAWEFFDLASDGFYHRGRLGTATLPVWMERGESSAQAVLNPELASEYAEIWTNLSGGFSGVFLEVAGETTDCLERI